MSDSFAATETGIETMPTDWIYNDIQIAFPIKDFPHINSLISQYALHMKSHNDSIYQWAKTFTIVQKQQATKSLSNELIYQTGSNQTKKRVVEDKILELAENQLIIGGAGSGKTTTLKRLYLHQKTSDLKNSRYKTAILIRLRELKSESISHEILKILNIKTHLKTFESVYFINDSLGQRVQKTKLTRLEYVGEQKIDEFVTNILNAGNTILFLDGLDQTPLNVQADIKRNIEQIASSLTTSKIILTSKGNYDKTKNKGFKTYQISPLDSVSAATLSKNSLNDNSDLFFKLLTQKTYVDIAYKPLIFNLLVYHFEHYHELPNYYFEIYNRTSTLLVKKWHQNSELIASFDADQKLDFLKEIAFYFSYPEQKITFSLENINAVYQHLYSKYDLPKTGIEIILQEIEIHTGLIVKGSDSHYEFSHLTIQKYLFAEYLVNKPIDAKSIEQFLQVPEAYAIATCITSSSESWMANLLLNPSFGRSKFHGKKRRKELFNLSLFTYLERLINESPRFSVSMDLGYVVIYLLFHANEKKTISFKNTLNKLFLTPNVQKSFLLALENYDVSNRNTDAYYIKLKKDVEQFDEVKYPVEGYLPKNIAIQIERQKF
ncbi:NACHT domain-containing protein [Reichenbachiella versicolor]|uniref:NACHT domain-containing protein n=1 Tax=Reichenbachiella versicolor TaxID=1821036 RepID=UPI000D6E91F9|nr:hypothetical protein [Reichenbachiella versicolor]